MTLNWNDLRGSSWDDLDDETDTMTGTIAGVSFVKGYPQNLIKLKDQLENMKTSFKQVFTEVRRNPHNEYDSNACEVWVNDEFIGHLPRNIAAGVAPRMDAGSKVLIDIVSVGFAKGDSSKPGAVFHLKVENASGAYREMTDDEIAAEELTWD